MFSDQFTSAFTPEPFALNRAPRDHDARHEDRREGSAVAWWAVRVDILADDTARGGVVFSGGRHVLVASRIEPHGTPSNLAWVEGGGARDREKPAPSSPPGRGAPGPSRDKPPRGTRSPAPIMEAISGASRPVNHVARYLCPELSASSLSEFPDAAAGQQTAAPAAAPGAAGRASHLRSVQAGK